MRIILTIIGIVIGVYFLLREPYAPVTEAYDTPALLAICAAACGSSYNHAATHPALGPQLVCTDIILKPLNSDASRSDCTTFEDNGRAGEKHERWCVKIAQKSKDHTWRNPIHCTGLVPQ